MSAELCFALSGFYVVIKRVPELFEVFHFLQSKPFSVVIVAR